MGCASISGLSFVPTLRFELCKPRSRTQKMHVSGGPGPPETRPFCLSRLGEDSPCRRKHFLRRTIPLKGMGCASIKWSVLRAYATLRNFVSPDLALRKCMSQEALGPPGDKTFCLKTWGRIPLSPLATVRVHFPPSLYEAFGPSQS